MLRHLGLAALSLALLCHPAGAYGAASPAGAGDPPAGSPAGSVYQLPFEEGRADAAPKGSGGTSADTGNDGASGTGDDSDAGGEESESLYRSENNFGSSSRVPGTSIASAGGPSAESGAEARGGAQDRTLGVVPGELSDSGNTSPTANIGLLILIGIVAAGIGVYAVRAHRLNAKR